MKRNSLLFTLTLFSCSLMAQLNMSFVGQFNYDEVLSDVWGYTAPDSTEYAIVGVSNGVSIVSLADPSNPMEVDFVPGVPSGWRDVKTWGDHAYVINEDGNGLAVIDLSPLPDSVNSYDWQPNIPGLGTLNTCHNLWIDEAGFAYLCGCNVNNGGLVFVDVASEPGTPIYAGKNAPAYSHDVYVRNNIAYSFEINEGIFTAYDVSDKDSPVALGSQETPFNVSHNGWLSDDSNILFTTDETSNAPVASFDVSDLTDIRKLDEFVPFETLGDGVVPHNVHVWNDFLIISYYTDGCILVDASRPENLVEVGNFDTFFPDATGFAGAWGAYPYLPSGLVLVSDMEDGLYVLEPNYVRACHLEGKVTDAATGVGLFNAKVDILTDNAFAQTGLIGDYGTGTAIAGTYEVEVKKPGYESKVVTGVVLENGEVTSLDVELVELPSFTYTGQVIDAETGEPVGGAKVAVQNIDFDYSLTTDDMGNFTIATFYDGNYEVIAGKWGYRTLFVDGENINETNNAITLELEKGIEDVFSLDLGWEISGNAIQGEFELGDPIGLNPQEIGGIFIQPEDDVDEDEGNSCYFTGNTANLQGGVQIAGTTRATSPLFDLSTMYEPRINFYTYLFTVNLSTFDVGNDPILVFLSNGIEEKVVATITHPNLFTLPAWNFTEIVVEDFMTPTDSMQIAFQIGDLDPNFSDVAEAGFDYFQAYDANPNNTNEVIEEGLTMSVYPNPFSNEITVDFELDHSINNPVAVVYNLLGQQIQSIALDGSTNRITLGKALNKGVYLLKVQGDDFESKAIRVIKQ